MKKTIKASDYSDIKKMFDEKKTISEISKKYGVSRVPIYTALRKGYGIELRRGNVKHSDKIGKKFGYLIVKDLIQRGKQFHWQFRAICECVNCGNKEFETSIQNIIRGRVTSCGCRRDQYEKITGENSSQFTGHKEIRGNTWSRFKRRVRDKGRKICFDIKWAWELYEKQDRKCAISGLPIVFAKHNGETTASIDRIDSTKGYEKNNVQWVHKDINIMKGIFPIDYFVSVCGLIYNKNPKIDFDNALKKGIKYGDFNKIRFG